MKMKKTVVILLLIYNIGQAQAQNCSQNLEDARRAYYNGQFREVLPKIESCLDQFTKGEQSEAYKLLVDNFLVLGENETADRYMSWLLKVDPTYSTRESDLVEFRNLFNTYQVTSRYSIGFTAGAMRPDYRIIKHQSISGVTEEPNDYQEIPGYWLGLTGEMPIINRFYLSTSVMFEQRGFEQKEIILGLQTIKSTEREFRLNIPLQIKYIHNIKRWRPFVAAGYSYHYLIHVKADLERFTREPEIEGTIIGVPYSEDNYDLSDLRRKSTFNWITSAGVQVPLRGGFLLEGRLTYERGLQNLIRVEKRFNDELIEDFGYLPDDFKVSAWMIGLTIWKHYTQPKKK